MSALRTLGTLGTPHRIAGLLSVLFASLALAGCPAPETDAGAASPIAETVEREGYLHVLPTKPRERLAKVAFGNWTSGSAVAVAGERILVASAGENALIVVNRDSLSEVARIDLGGSPSQLVTKKGKVWLTLTRFGGHQMCGDAQGVQHGDQEKEAT